MDPIVIAVGQRLARVTVLAVVLVAAALPFASSPAAAASPLRVAIIVGPVGEELTPQYIELAEMAADEAERAGATVVRAYSPKATPRRVLRAVDGANIVIYFGHGTGFPNPYSQTLNPAVDNGWGLQGPRARGTHEDDLAKGRLAYYGEAWLAANAHPAPGFVMIYSNACYAPGASEGWLPKPDEAEALTHVANYSRAAFAMGASAYYATDFYGGAARLVHALLDQSGRTFANVFRSEPQFRPDALSRHAHPQVPGTQIWLHRSAYFDGNVDYWYAFAGNPTAQHGRCPRPVRAAGTRRGTHVDVAHRHGEQLSVHAWLRNDADRGAAGGHRRHVARLEVALGGRLRGPLRQAAGGRRVRLLLRNGRRSGSSTCRRPRGS